MDVKANILRLLEGRSKLESLAIMMVVCDEQLWKTPKPLPEVMPTEGIEQEPGFETTQETYDKIRAMAVTAEILHLVEDRHWDDNVSTLMDIAHQLNNTPSEQFYCPARPLFRVPSGRNSGRTDSETSQTPLGNIPNSQEEHGERFFTRAADSLPADSPESPCCSPIDTSIPDPIFLNTEPAPLLVKRKRKREDSQDEDEPYSKKPLNPFMLSKMEQRSMEAEFNFHENARVNNVLEEMHGERFFTRAADSLPADSPESPCCSPIDTSIPDPIFLNTEPAPLLVKRKRKREDSQDEDEPYSKKPLNPFMLSKMEQRSMEAEFNFHENARVNNVLEEMDQGQQSSQETFTPVESTESRAENTRLLIKRQWRDRISSVLNGLEDQLMELLEQAELPPLPLSTRDLTPPEPRCTVCGGESGRSHSGSSQTPLVNVATSTETALPCRVEECFSAPEIPQVVIQNTEPAPVLCTGRIKKTRKREDRQDKDKPYIKRPLNAFMLFTKEQRSKVAEANRLDSAQVNKVLGEMWRSLPADQQAKYYVQASEEQKLHKQQHPDWSMCDNYGQKRKPVRTRAPRNGEVCRD